MSEPERIPTSSELWERKELIDALDANCEWDDLQEAEDVILETPPEVTP